MLEPEPDADRPAGGDAAGSARSGGGVDAEPARRGAAAAGRGRGRSRSDGGRRARGSAGTRRPTAITSATPARPAGPDDQRRPPGDGVGGDPGVGDPALDPRRDLGRRDHHGRSGRRSGAGSRPASPPGPGSGRARRRPGVGGGGGRARRRRGRGGDGSEGGQGRGGGGGPRGGDEAGRVRDAAADWSWASTTSPFRGSSGHAVAARPGRPPRRRGWPRALNSDPMRSEAELASGRTPGPRARPRAATLRPTRRPGTGAGVRSPRPIGPNSGHVDTIELCRGSVAGKSGRRRRRADTPAPRRLVAQSASSGSGMPSARERPWSRKRGRKRVDEDRDGDLGRGVVHPPDADAGLVEVGVHLDVVLLVDGERDGDLFEPAVGQGVDAGAADGDRRQGLERLVVDPAEVGDDRTGGLGGVGLVLGQAVSTCCLR